jgi:hypothetical protein
MLTVHVRVNDRSTGKPVPARLRISDSRGVYYPPLGRLAHFRTGRGEDVGGQVLLAGRPHAYIDGACEVPLPAGPLLVEISRGPEYLPLRQQVHLAAGQMALRFTLARWANLAEEGWHPGDVRAHDLSPHAALLEGAAEGLEVVQLQARERPPVEEVPGAVPNLLAFSGTAAALRSPHCVVSVNTLNAHPVLGTVALLNCHRPVFPLRSGQPGLADHWSVADWCDQCHRKKGLVVWPDLPRLCEEAPQGEALAALILGKIDAFEVGPSPDPEAGSLRDYYRLLDCGLLPVLVGGSGKTDNTLALGTVRTYAYLPPGQEIDSTPWIEAVRAGRTFITSGPILSLNVDGHGPGSVLDVVIGQRLHLRAEARCALPCDCVELIAGGKVIASAAACSASPFTATVEAEHLCTSSTWLAARCRGGVHPNGGTALFAHTTPVHLQVARAPLQPAAEMLAPLLAVLEGTLAWVDRRAVCESEKQRGHLREVLTLAREELLKRRDEG